MTKSFNKFKKSIFSILGGKKFLQIIRLSRTNCQNLGKTNNTIPRNWRDKRKSRWKDGQKDRHTIFYKIFLANDGCPKIIASCDLSITDFGCLPWLVGGDTYHYSYWVHEMKREQTSSWLNFCMLYFTDDELAFIAWLYSLESINSVVMPVSKYGGGKFLGIWLCLGLAQDLV